MIGKPWTTKQLERVWTRMRAGTHINIIAAEYGCTVTNVHKRLRGGGYDPKNGRRTEFDESAEHILAQRKAGREFRDIATDLGLEPTPANVRRLYMRLVRYCERFEIPYPKAKRRPRRTVAKAVNLDTICRCINVVRQRTQRGEQTDILDLCDAAGFDARLTKATVAEMRRRNILANGCVPSSAGLKLVELNDPSTLTPMQYVLLKNIVTAWNTHGTPCEALDSLAEKTGYPRSSVNIALVKLRSLGLLEPRGFLYLRKPE